MIYRSTKVSDSESHRFEYIDIDDICITKHMSGSYVNDFEDNQVGMSVKGTADYPTITTDPADAENNVLSIKAGNYTTTNMVLPVQLAANTEYTLRFKYKANVNVGLFKNSSFGISETLDDTAFTSQFAYFKSEQGLDDGSEDYKYDYNKSRITNTEWLTREFIFTTDESNLTDTAKYFKIILQPIYNEETAAYVYLDDISLFVNPTVSFVTNSDSAIDSIKVSPNNTIDVMIPEKDGYDFAGWYFDEEFADYAGYNTIVAPKDNTILYAKWTVKQQAGDLNRDGSINAMDLTLIRQYLLNSSQDEDLREYISIVGDCNGDNLVNIIDVVRLKKYIADPVNVNLGITLAETSISGYSLVWNDEFDSEVLDTTKWGITEGATNTLTDGVLTLSSKSVNDYIRLQTTNTMNFKQGYIEVRAKLPYFGMGEWPAIWMLSGNANIAKSLVSYDSNLSGMEIDIAENIGWTDKFQSQFHKYPVDGDSIKNILTDSVMDITNTSDWHTYGLYWSADELKFFLDGDLLYTYTIPDEDKSILNQHTNLIISLNSYSAGTYFESYENLDLSVDYVRLYQNEECSCLIAK